MIRMLGGVTSFAAGLTTAMIATAHAAPRTAAELKTAVCEAIDRRAAELTAIAEDIYLHPELGFKEFRTAKIVSEYFERLGLPHRDGLAITGVKAKLQGGAGGPTVAVLG